MRLLAVALTVVALPAAAQVMEKPMCDPCVPQALRSKARVEPGSTGAALRLEVEAKLRMQFMAAAPAGTLSRAQAEAGGLGFIARHFTAIDRDGRGVVGFDDYKRFLRERGAALD